MKSLLRNTLGAITSLVFLLTLFLAPQSSLARNPRMSDGNGSGSGGSNEGDPLDSNDSGGGSGGGDVHEGRSIPQDYDDRIINILDSNRIMILRVDYIGDIPVFSVEIVSEKEFRSEEYYGR